MAADPLPNCPKCHQTDQIQKVTSLYGVNTEEWYETEQTGSGTHSSSRRVHHEAHTQLGLRLHPPSKPVGPTHPGWVWGIVGLILFIVLSALCPFALVPLFVLVPLLVPLLAGSAAPPTPPAIAGLPSGTTLVIIIGGGALCVGLAGLAVIIWLGLRLRRRFDRGLAEYREKKAAYEGDELPHWQSAQKRWEQLYYCMRDETVFIPAENKAIRAEDMEKYLYDSFFRSQS